MPDEAAYKRQPSFHGPRPAMATHWPAPPGGWSRDEDWQLESSVTEPRPTSWLLDDDGASTKSSPDPGPPGAGAGGAASEVPSAYAAPPPTPARSRPKHLPLILSVIAGILVLGLVAGAAIATAVSVHRYRQDRRLATVGMDQPVRDGSFQFTADRMRCGVHEIGPPDDFQSPSGQFCVITLTIKNVGTTPAIFADAIQKAYGSGGVWFGSDSEAAFYANPDPMIFFNDINPGNKVQALVVYDIPPGGHILRLEVHENPTTRGAIIKIA